MTRTHAPRGSIVVGVDASTASDVALEWAVEEATRRRLPVHLLHAYTQELVVALPPELEGGEPRTDAVIDAALARVHTMNPQLSVTFAVPYGSAAGELVDASADADTVVIGARGRSTLGGIVLGSVSLGVAMHAACPVVVVRERSTLTGPSAGRVVVGVDGSEVSAAAVGYAFAHASSRDVGLTVVHAWWLEFVEGSLASAPTTEAVETDWEHIAEGQRLVVAESLAGWREKYPDVEVREHIVKGHPVEALVDESDGAELLVVGTRGKGGFTGLMLGSVSHGVLHRAHCPVAVARPAPAASE